MNLKISMYAEIGVKGIISENGTVIYANCIIPNMDLKEVREALKEVRPYPLYNGSVRLGFFDFSRTIVEKSRVGDSIAGGIRSQSTNVIYLSSEVKNPSDMLNQFFLIQKNQKDREEIENEIKESFFKYNLKKLPIPIRPEWYDAFWNSIKDRLVELDSDGDVPYVGYKLQIPTIEDLNENLSDAHSESEFIRYHKRAPRIKALLVIGDIENFNFKGWQKFLTENFPNNSFQGLTSLAQKRLVRTTECFGFDIKPKLYDNHVFTHINLSALVTMFRQQKEKSKKLQYQKFLNELFQEFDSKFFSIAVDNFKMLLEEQFENLRDKQYEPIMKALSKIQYNDIDPEINVIHKKINQFIDKDFEEEILSLPEVCSKNSISQKMYTQYEELYLANIDKAMHCAVEFPTITKSINRKVSFEVMNVSNPRSLVVGLEVNCCQHLGSVGDKCLHYFSANPSSSGIFRVDDSGQTIAQSFFWLQKSAVGDTNILVLDSIEVLGGANLARDSVVSSYQAFLDEFEKYAKLFNVSAITAGVGYGDSAVRSQLKIGNTDEATFGRIPDALRYTDARSQILLKRFDLTI